MTDETKETQTRKGVQMHMVAHSIAKTMAEGVPDSFGQSFWHNKVYFSKDLGNPVFVENMLIFHLQNG